MSGAAMANKPRGRPITLLHGQNLYVRRPRAWRRRCRTTSAGLCHQIRAWVSWAVPERESPRVTDRSSSVSGVAERYASALFDLARDQDSLAQVESELQSVTAMLDESEDLRRLVHSPAFSADDQFSAISALADRAGIGGLTGNFLRLVAKNRRLFALPGIITAFRDMAANHRGEVTAEVTSAHPLSDAQTGELKAALKEKLGKDVTLHTRVDPALLGGLVVRVGSRMIDTSLRTRLMTIKTQLKEVG